VYGDSFIVRLEADRVTFTRLGPAEPPEPRPSLPVKSFHFPPSDGAWG
jgi:hypothetical protein